MLRKFKIVEKFRTEDKVKGILCKKISIRFSVGDCARRSEERRDQKIRGFCVMLTPEECCLGLSN